ncbi:MAG: tetratricopeptide repeat protein [Clostridia bacterium]|nr:tetratricopeptide repeat protein [Clostridia bacterium]
MSLPQEPLSKKDYEEPCCLLIDETNRIPAGIRPIPQQRVIAKMDEIMARRDYAGAERHLLYWLEEAKAGHDERGELLVRNELVGHYRKTGNREAGFEQAEQALALLQKLEYDGTISSGTTYTNIATMYHAFGESEKAWQYFEKAKTIYEAAPNTGAELLGGLYNNMGLVSVSLGRFDEAFALYEKAMETMARVRFGELEQAITCLNMANAVEAQVGLEAGEKRIFELVDQAVALLDTESIPHGGYYAFVCEKCAPTLSYYGYFTDAERFRELSDEIVREENAK